MEQDQILGSWLRPNLLQVNYRGRMIPSWEYYLQCHELYCQQVQRRASELGGQTVYLLHTLRQVRLPLGNPTQPLISAYRLVPDCCICYVVATNIFTRFALGYVAECLGATPRLKFADTAISVLELARSKSGVN